MRPIQYADIPQGAKMEKCDICGEHLLNCDCFDDTEWHSFKDLKPSPGQRCRVKRQHIYDAYYNPSDGHQWDDFKLKDISVISWRPLYGKD